MLPILCSKIIEIENTIVNKKIPPPHKNNLFFKFKNKINKIVNIFNI